MEHSAGSVRTRIVIGEIDMVPRVVQIYEIPCVVHLIAGDKEARDVHFPQDCHICERICLTNAFFFGQKVIYIENTLVLWYTRVACLRAVIPME